MLFIEQAMIFNFYRKYRKCMKGHQLLDDDYFNLNKNAQSIGYSVSKQIENMW